MGYVSVCDDQIIPTERWGALKRVTEDVVYRVLRKICIAGVSTGDPNGVEKLATERADTNQIGISENPRLRPVTPPEGVRTRVVVRNLKVEHRSPVHDAVDVGYETLSIMSRRDDDKDTLGTPRTGAGDSIHPLGQPLYAEFK